MSSDDSKNRNDVASCSERTAASTKTRVSRRRSENSRRKSSSESGPFLDYMKTVDDGNGGVSLYTHVRLLIDMFVFQNPVSPIKYFEYYSGKLKEHRHRPGPDLDAEFLDNIEPETCEKMTDIRNRLIALPCNLRYDDNDDDDDDGDGVFEDDYFGRENDETDYIVDDGKENETAVQDLSLANYMFNKAGCGVTNDETYFIETVMNHLSNRVNFKSVRYWGKIFGLTRDYYVLECEWRTKQIECKLIALNNLTANANATFDFENDGNDELLSEMGNEMFSAGRSSDLAADENGDYSDGTAPLADEQPAPDTDGQSTGSVDNSAACFPSAAEPLAADNQFSYETIGFGANKKSYFVANEPYGEWTELPLLKPHHVVQSRGIRRYFVGDLESPVESFPLFQGLEKHYLRAQIARITAETRVSPRDYFTRDGDHNAARSIRTKKLTSFQRDVLSRTHVHDYAINRHYDPAPVYDLLRPANWVHYTPLITDEGVTNAWTEIMASAKYNEKETGGGRYNRNSDGTDDLFRTVSDEQCAPDCVPAWKFELTNEFDHRVAYVSARSNVWPGAFAIAGNELSDCTYLGWGHQRAATEFEGLVTGLVYRSEGPLDDDMTEAKDPTYAEQMSFIERAIAEKERRRRAPYTTIAPLNEGDDEERLISKYDYN